MVLSGRKSYHFAATRGDGGMCFPSALPRPNAMRAGHDKSCPCRRWLQICELEGVTQRELNQPRRSHAGDDSSESRRVLNVRHCRIREVGVVPNIKEIRREAQFLPLGQTKILQHREVPVLLMRSAIDVASEIAEQRDDTISSQRSRDRTSRNEIRDIQVTIVDTGVNIAARQTCAERTTRSELRARSTGFQPATDERRTCGRIQNGKGRARLENGNSADGPSAQKCFLQSHKTLEERQVIAVADDQAMRAVKIG